jgi:hypothetical protein
VCRVSAAAELDVVGLGNTNGIGNYWERNLGYDTVLGLGWDSTRDLISVIECGNGSWVTTALVKTRMEAMAPRRLVNDLYV